MLGRVTAFVYGLVAYVAFLGALLYLMGFVGNLGVPRSIDRGPEASLGMAVSINVLLIALFALQHTVMARPAFKAWFTKFVPAAVERSTFVLVASALLALLCWQWRPVPTVVWHVGNPLGQALLTGLFFAGWGLVVLSSFLINHFDLFGMRQVYLNLVGKPYTHPQFRTVSLYKHIRHPLMAGFLIGMWSTPTMTLGHLVFAVVMTGYTFMGIAFEERDLAGLLGAEYERYRRQTPMLLPIPRRHEADRVARGDRRATAGTKQGTTDAAR